ncbi:MAG: hypothetical protein DDT39_00970 [Firmicutes bacterium]|nr:hypothetical protein [candidate division NPL-UPA2 bacterium]
MFNVVLPRDFAKPRGAPLPVQRLVSHRFHLPLLWLILPCGEQVFLLFMKARRRDCCLGGNLRPRPVFDYHFRSLTLVVNSNQATRRHTRLHTYRCFLPDLTGFMGSCCVGPNCHRYLLGANPTNASRNTGFCPATADCRFRAPLLPRIARPSLNNVAWFLLCLIWAGISSKSALHLLAHTR